MARGGSTPAIALVSAALAVACTIGGCKRSAPTAADAGAQGGQTPGAGAGAGGANGVAAPGANAAPQGSDPGDLAAGAGHELVPADYDAAVSTITLGSGSSVTPGASAPAPEVDPFDAAVASAKAQAVGCFAPLPPGEYAVSLAVSVSPAGRATRVETSSGSVTDASVLSCIRGVGEARSWPSSASGRSLSIDVRVSGQ